MTDRPVVSPRRTLIGITLLSSLCALPAPVLAQNNPAATAVAADPLTLAAEDAASCRELRDPDIRLACLDAAAQRLAEALDSINQHSMDQHSKDQRSIKPAGRNVADLPTAPAAPDVPNAADVPDAPTAVEPSGEAADEPPTWAAAPQRPDTNQDEAPERFEATIVRITRNNVGRHRFYTDDGAVWEQTQIVEVLQPESLPAVAEFRRKLTGSPTIKFDVSGRSYRVRRIE